MNRTCVWKYLSFFGKQDQKNLHLELFHCLLSFCVKYVPQIYKWASSEASEDEITAAEME